MRVHRASKQTSVTFQDSRRVTCLSLPRYIHFRSSAIKQALLPLALVRTSLRDGIGRVYERSPNLLSPPTGSMHQGKRRFDILVVLLS